MKSNPVAARLLIAAAIVSWLAACGGGSGSSAEPPPPSTDGRAQALAVSRPGELAAYVQQRLRARPAGAASDGQMFSALPPTLAAVPVAGVADSAPPTRSGTLVQEAGVDEADLLQSDGTHLYTLQPRAQQANSLRLQAYQRTAVGGLNLLKTLDLTDAAASSLWSGGMHLSSDGRVLAVVSESVETLPTDSTCKTACTAVGVPLLPWIWTRSNVNVQRVDASDPANTSAGERLSIEGHLVGSRRIADTLVLVTRHSPRLPVDVLPATATAAEREAAIAGLAAADVLPTLRRNGGPAQALLSDTDCYLQTANASLAVEITTITLIDLKSPTLARSSRCMVGGTEAVYMSAASLYLATTRSSYQLPGLITPMVVAYPLDMRTDIHKFALDAGSVVYRGSGDVAGHLGWDSERKPYRLSEHNGDLRVLSFTGSTGWLTVDDAASKPASPATLTVLRERASDLSLQTVATLPNGNRPAALGKAGEQVYAVRFAGDRGYVVTFRRADPLYVLDLSNPADPKSVGELVVSGYSEQIFPLSAGLLLGVGREADSKGVVSGLKLALFDVADPTRPKQTASFSMGGAQSNSALDYSSHGLNYFMKSGVARIALPVNLAPPGPTFAVGGWQAGLLRFEVDTASGSMRELPMRGAVTSNYDRATWLERSLQIGDQVYYLAEGQLKGYDW